jgi:hypothetical protein
MVEGYRNELELFNLECWALTAESLFHTAEWIWLYKRFGYTGDYASIPAESASCGGTGLPSIGYAY